MTTNITQNSSNTKMNFDTTSQTFLQLMAAGQRYRVPPFQRNYSWTQEEWEELWQDMTALLREDSEEAHYMGYLVLQSTEDRKFEIIDGQQRIATLSIMILAGLDCLKDLADSGFDAENNRKRMAHFRSIYIGDVEPVSLVTFPKLSLNRYDDPFYQTYLVPLVDIPRYRLKPSERQLRNVFVWFKKKLQEYSESQEDKGIALVKFLDQVVTKLLFTVIKVTDGLNAFKVFETLNARGVRLSATDLLKNYLFSLIAEAHIHEKELLKLDEEWAWITDQVGSSDFPRYLRAYWNSRHLLVRQKDLFKKIRNEIVNRETAYDLLRELKKGAGIWVALNDPEDKRWRAKERKYLKEMKLFDVKQPLPLLMICYEQFFDSKRRVFERILRVISIISFRYKVICNLHAGELETTLNKVAQKIFSGVYSNAPTIVKALQVVYPSDDSFQDSFKTKNLNTTKAISYILGAIEKHKWNQQPDETWTLEHVLPKNADDDIWQGIPHDRLDDLVYRLGNMTMLEKNANQQAGSDSYETKKKIYKASNCNLSKEIAERCDNWDEDAIDRRQSWLAQYAVDIWRI